MHELSLAERAMAIVEKTAAQAGARRITRVRLRVGALAHVEADTLVYCCEMVAASGLAAGAVIECEREAGRVWCETCACEQPLSRIGDPCPVCGGYALQVRDGDRLSVVDIGIE